MNSELFFQTGFCNDYESLLHKCEDARQACAVWRAEMNVPSAVDKINKDVSDELLRLQAKYAKSYAQLAGHSQHCDLCQFVARMSEAQRIFQNPSCPLEETLEETAV